MTGNHNPPEDQALNHNEQLFVEEYLVDRNATAAMRRTGYAGKHPDVEAFQMKNRPNVKKAIEQRIQQRLEDIGVRVDAVLQEVVKLAFSNMADYLGQDLVNREFDFSSCTRDQMAAISEFFIDKDGKIKIKLADKKAALELLGKYLKMWTDKTEATNTLQNPDGTALKSPVIQVVFKEPEPA